MKNTLAAVSMLLVTFTATAYAADDTDALIALDKQWGESGVKGETAVAAKLLADKVVSVTAKGVRGKQGELADNEPAPAGTRYEPTDYKVTFINADTAIMTHGTKGADAHYSLHVWSRKGGTWQIVATSTTPAASEK
ncbi:MAG: nuclear transport factor 2 family protein [Gammaproteobacteria bacterium]